MSDRDAIDPSDFPPGLVHTYEHMQCGICSEWFVCLGPHILSAHEMRTHQYRELYGLNRRQSLESPRRRHQKSEEGKRRDMELLRSTIKMSPADRGKRAMAGKQWRPQHDRAHLSAIQQPRSHCPQGHAYEGDNVKLSGGVRVCVICRRQQDAAFKQRRKEAS